MRGLLRLALFLVLGPLLGLLGMALLIGSYTLATTGSPRDFALGPGLLAPGILLLAYTIGIIPALVSGVISLIVAPRVSGWRYWLCMALVGAIASFAFSFVVFGGGPEMMGTTGQSGPVVALVTTTGALAAFACAALFDGFAALAARRT